MGRGLPIVLGSPRRSIISRPTPFSFPPWQPRSPLPISNLLREVTRNLEEASPANRGKDHSPEANQSPPNGRRFSDIQVCQGRRGKEREGAEGEERMQG